MSNNPYPNRYERHAARVSDWIHDAIYCDVGRGLNDAQLKALHERLDQCETGEIEYEAEATALVRETLEELREEWNDADSGS